MQVLLQSNWTSPLEFSPGLTPTLGGTLDLELADGVDPFAVLGQTFQLFDWSSPLPSGDQFGSVITEPGVTFDLSNLYTTGAVTVTGVPEPSSLAMGVASSIGFALLVRGARQLRAANGRPFNARRVTDP